MASRLLPPLVALLVLLAGVRTGASQASPGTFRISAEGVPGAAVVAVEADLAWAEARIEAQLGAFPDTVSVRIFAARAGFTDALREA